MAIDVNQIDFYKTIMNAAPASIHVLEINDKLEAAVLWGNKQYESETGIDMEERGKLGFLDQTKVFNPDDAKEILAAFAVLYKATPNKNLSSPVSKPVSLPKNGATYAP